jgi:excisionase family DNA binding protein
MPNTNELLDIAQAAEFLQVSETSLRRWTNSGRLRCLRIGRRRERRFLRADLLAFLESEGGELASATSTGAQTATDPKKGTADSEHLCGLYSSDEGMIQLAMPFLLAGLREGSTCFLVSPADVADGIVKRMSERRQSLPDEITSRMLVLSPYLQTAREQWDYFDREISAAMRRGAQSVRIFGDVAGIRNSTNPAAIVEYEEGFDQLIVQRYPSKTLCGYDARKFDGVEIMNALRCHPDTLRHPLQAAFA